jgi:hypothetical protein
MLLDLLLKYVPGGCAYLLVNHLAALDKEYAGDRGNAVVNAQVGIFVHINLAYVYAAFIFLGQGINGGAQSQAGTAPGGPEINYGKLFAIDNFGLEIRICEYCCHFVLFRKFEDTV